MQNLRNNPANIPTPVKNALVRAAAELELLSWLRQPFLPGVFRMFTQEPHKRLRLLIRASRT